MSDAPLSYRVHATTGPDGTTVEAGASSLSLDTRWDAPATGDPGPADLLASAFAACLLKNLARTQALTGFEYDAADVTVELTRQEQPPLFVSVRYRLQVVTAEPPRRVELMHTNLRRFGTVYNTLAAVCDVEGTVETVSPG